MADKPSYEELEQKVKELEKESLERKRAEQALRESEERLQHLMETVPVGISISSPEGDIIEANATILKMFGYRSKEDLLKTAASDHYYDIKDRERFIELMQKGLSRNFEVQFIRQGGTLFWGSVTSLPRTTATGTIQYINVVQDISERKHVERTLSQKHAELEATFNSIPDAVVCADLNRNMTKINPGFTKLFGCEPKDVYGKKTRMLYTSEEEFTKQGKIRYNPDARDMYDAYEIEYRKKNGEVFLSETIGTPVRDERDEAIGLFAIVRDITKSKQAEEALRESEEKYRTLFEDSRDAIYMTTRDGSFIDVNESALDLFGYTREEIIGMNAKQTYVNPEDRRQFQQEIEEKGSVRHYEVKLRKKDGAEMYCLLSSSVRKANDGSILGYQGIIHDVTAQKHLEAKLQQAQKLEAIGTLAGGIAHDFNNLLTGIQGNASLMLMDMDSTNPCYERLKTIENQVQSGAKLTSHLLGYARKGKYEVKPIDLNRLVKDASKAFSRTRKQITLSRELAEDLFAIEADQGQIEQVLWNLFVNAADAMPGGGDLILKTDNVTHEDMKGKLYDPKPGSYVLLTVADTGIGMDKQTIDRIFDPFFTTKEMGRGTGLGLASAYGIIKAHAGYIDVESEPGHGTTFGIYLPASEKEVQRVVRTAEEVIEGTGTILLVDDEEVILEVGKDLLEAMGYRVLLATDGKEAIEVYRKNQDEIDIVVLDMVMPTMGGGEAYDRIKEINPDIKVLLSSGYSIDGEATEILERGCSDFIQKPFRTNELAQKIREILDKK